MSTFWYHVDLRIIERSTKFFRVDWWYKLVIFSPDYKTRTADSMDSFFSPLSGIGHITLAVQPKVHIKSIVHWSAARVLAGGVIRSTTAG